MLAILPILSLTFLFLLLNLKRPAPAGEALAARAGDWRPAVLAASVIAGSYAVLMTNTLSMMDLLRPDLMTAGWLLAIVALAIAFVMLRKRGWQLDLGFGKLTPFSWILVGAMTLLGAMMCMIALIAPPNNWDSQVYHMPRIMHWLQNGNVSLYPTNCPRQNHQNMGAEYIILQFQALTGGDDRFANLPHWLAYAGSILAVSLIAKLLGAGTRGQILAAVFAATAPMAILQSTSTQSDMLSAYWTIVFVYYAIRWLVEGRMSRSLLLLIGASLGLATLTKSTTYSMALPFLIWLSIGFLVFLRRKPAKLAAILTFGILITIPFMTLNLPSYVRNMALYEHPLGPRTEGGSGSGDLTYTNPVMSPAIFASNYVRNIALHFGIFPLSAPQLQLKKNASDPKEISPLKQFQDYLEGQVKAFHKVLGVSPDDPRFSWGGTPFAIPSVYFADENDGDPLQMALLLVLSPIFLLAVLVFICVPSLRPRTPWNALILWLAAQGAVVLFSLILRWQPWHSRLHIVLFLMFAPMIGFVMDWLPKARGVRWPLIVLGNMVALLMIASGFLWGSGNMQRGLWGGGNIFVRSRDDLQVSCAAPSGEPFREMALFMKGKNIHNIGMLQGGEPMEYFYWVFLRKYMSTDFRMMDLYAAGPSLIGDTLIATIEKTDPREAARLRKQNEYMLHVIENYKKLYDKPAWRDFMPDALIHSKTPGPGPLPIGPDGVVKYKDKGFRLAWTSANQDVYLPANQLPAGQKPVQFPISTPTPTQTQTPAPAKD